MLHPGRCSAWVSSKSTWLGAPGAERITASIGERAGGGRLGPPAAEISESRKALPRRTSHSRSGSQSSSVKARISPVAASAPILRAALRPEGGMESSRTSGNFSATISFVKSVDPSSTTMVSNEPPSISEIARRQFAIRAPPLRVQTMTEKRWFATGGVGRKSLQTRSAGFGFPSRSVMPKLQSRISRPAFFHRSLHA